MFLVAGFSDGASANFNHTWAAEFGSSLSFSDIYPKHLPGLWHSLGGYDFFFYGPLPFWVAGGLIAPLCPSCSTSTEVLLTASFFWLLSGATFFVFARRYFSVNISLLGSLVYLLLPYHLWMDWFIRQAIGEFAAFAFLPLIAFGIDSVRRNDGHGWTVAIGVAGLMLSHLPTMLLAAHVFAVIMLAIAFEKWRQKEAYGSFIFSISLWVILGAFVTSFYWMPALALLDTVSPNILFSEFFRASNWLWGTTSSSPQPYTSMVLLSGFFVTLPTVLLSLYFARGTLLIWIVIPFSLTVLMNSGLSAPVWNNWVIQKVQFPWRFLVFSDFAAGVAVMVVFSKIATPTRAKLAVTLSFMALVPFYKIALPAVGAIMTSFDESTMPYGAIEYLSPETRVAIERRFGVTLTHDKHILMVPKMLELMAQDVQKQLPAEVTLEASSRSYTVENVPDQQSLVLPIQYWQFWTGQLEDGTPLQLSANPDFGVIEVLAPEDGFNGQTIHLSLPYHISEKISLILSLVSIAGFAYLMKGTRSRRRDRTQNQKTKLQHIQ
ncbi:hypothetical protein [Aliiroseovarius sp. S253]|uniref:hypothetical protein n=1 Tax=Aliiroseovarius sp. S253 TaxID=3415133 RepID=UPI003C7C0312